MYMYILMGKFKLLTPHIKSNFYSNFQSSLLIDYFLQPAKNIQYCEDIDLPKYLYL